MNLLLHNVGPTPQELAKLRADLIAAKKKPDQADAEIDRRLPVRTDDGLRELGSARYNVVLTNPPFGRKSSILVVADTGDTEREQISYEREDFWASTTNKQLNFVQHVKSLLDIHGRAAVVVPDNVLFEGGAGETIRRKLLHECEVHTLLRLPTGIFYAQGVKANVLFFDRKPASAKPWTRKLWVYDLRTNQHFTLKTNPMKRADLDDFVALQARRTRQAQAHLVGEPARRPLARLRLRRAGRARQVQPRPVLAQGREPPRRRQPPRPRHHRPGDRRRPPQRPRADQRHPRGPGDDDLGGAAAAAARVAALSVVLREIVRSRDRHEVDGDAVVNHEVLVGRE
jgi:type I restriction-modification system DNA methylase subunit